jgi:DNA-binding MarR family transcriptional regulator
VPSKRASLSGRHRPAGARWTSEHVADRLHSMAIHLLRRVRREDDRSGLSSPRLSALSVIVFAGPLTLSQLAAAEQVRPPTMTRVVDGLEAAGLVRRKRDPDDGRMWLIAATPQGEALLQEGRKRRVAVLTQLIGDLSPSQRRTLQSAIRLVETILETPT